MSGTAGGWDVYELLYKSKIFCFLGNKQQCGVISVPLGSYPNSVHGEI